MILLPSTLFFFFWPSLLIRRRSYLYYLAFEFSSLCYLPHSSAIIFLSSSMSSDMHKAETDTMMALFLQLTISYSSVPLSSLVVHVLFLCAFRNVYYRRWASTHGVLMFFLSVIYLFNFYRYLILRTEGNMRLGFCIRQSGPIVIS